ncbi:A-type flagellin [Rhodobacteraceae bacterium SB2]|nr:A-type flagellin [Rhodobacteraceae bacterium SB2]
MALNIATDTAFLLASKSSDRNTITLNQSMERLTSGLRINSASDDAAGVAVATRINSDVQGMRMAIRNATDGQSMINTAEGAMVEITNILQRMRELAIQAANGTNSPTDRDMIQLEIDQLTMEVDRIAQSTQWAGQSIFNGARGANELATSHTEAYTTNFQIGSTPNDGDNITVNFYAITSEALDIEGTGTVPTIATTFATADSGAVAINPTDGKVTLSGAFAADDKITMTVNGQAIQTTLTNTDIIDTGAIAVNGTSAVSAGEYYITSMGTTDFTTSNSGISASVTSPIADSNDGANGLGSIITVAANTTSLTGTGRVKAIKTDADINVAADGKQFKVVNDSSVFYDASLSSTSVAGGSTTAITNAKTYLVTEGAFVYGSDTFTAGQSFLAASTTTVTASGSSALVEITAVDNTDGTAPTDSSINNIANTESFDVTAGKSYLITKGSITYNSQTFAAGSTFVGVTGQASATAGSASSVLSTATDFEAGAVIEKASGLYIGPSAKLVNYDSPAAAAQQIVAKLQAEGITGLNLTDNIDGTFNIVLGGNLSVASATDSHKAINSIDLALQNISADRAMFGALSNRFDMSISNLSNVAANSEMSLGRLQDADFAAETSRMTTSRILEQASIAMMAQANAAKQNVLQLLG